MKKLFLFVLVIIASGNLHAQQLWKVQSSEVSFIIKNAGLRVNGKLGGLKTVINFDNDKLATADIQASVDVSTISTGIEMRDEHLKKDDFFDAKKYPEIKLKSVKITGSGPNYNGIFNLTIKNLSKQITIPFTFKNCNNSDCFNASFKINRRDFNVGGSSFIMSDDVEVNIMLMAIPVK